MCVACAADELLEFALKRIERFEHVGTTEKLFPSVESAAAALKMPLVGSAYGAGEVRLHEDGGTVPVPNGHMQLRTLAHDLPVAMC